MRMLLHSITSFIDARAIVNVLSLPGGNDRRHMGRGQRSTYSLGSTRMGLTDTRCTPRTLTEAVFLPCAIEMGLNRGSSLLA